MVNPKIFKNKFIFIDFEFNSSQEKRVNLVSCSILKAVGNKPRPKVDKTKEFWLKDDKKQQRSLKETLHKLGQKYTFVAYAASAECRCFTALGLKPEDYQWIDLYFEHRQLTFNYKKCKYGTYFTKTGLKRHSVPPKFDPRKNKYKDNNEIGMGYVDAVALHTGQFVDSKHKTVMRDLIIANKKYYTEAEQSKIMEYCTSDIVHLPVLLFKMTNILAEAIRTDTKTIRKYQLTRGEFAASLSHMEDEGFPVLVDQILNLRKNYDLAKDKLLDKLEKVYPFYVREKKKKRDLRGVWKKKYDNFYKFIDEHPNLSVETWEKTDKTKDLRIPERGKKLKTDAKTLEKFDGIPELYALRQTQKIIDQLKWFQIPSDPLKDFMNNVGSDGRLRAFLGAYGTQTCVSSDALVYSKQRGYLRITEVSTFDHLWDGEQFVQHEGLKYTGLRDVIDFHGVRVTPDHRFLNTDGEWQEAQYCTHPLRAHPFKASGGSKSKNIIGKKYLNPTGGEIKRIDKRTGRFDSGFIATNSKFLNHSPSRIKDRYKRNESGGFMGDVLGTPSSYKEAKVKWESMNRRVSNKLSRLSYEDTTICDKWANFSNFAEWYESNKHPDNESPVIDKDYIVNGNREYSPSKCLVITDRLNRFIVGSTFKTKESLLPTGVYPVESPDGLYETRISISGRVESVGFFDSISLATEAYHVAKDNLFYEVLEEEKKYLTDETYAILKTFRLGKGCGLLNSEKRVPVYDITNCGPNSRFAIYNNKLEGMIAHNSRNAPKAKQFILAMSSWLRCLIQPGPDEAIVAIDYASQEFIIAAILSKDPVMIEAYESGDPYLYFSVKGRAVSETEGEWWKSEKKKLSSIKGYKCPDMNRYKQVDALRDLFKATTLGLQYGMGAENLAIKLTADTGKKVSVKEATKLITLHQSTYRVYWAWLKKINAAYDRNGYLLLRDGFALLPNNDNSLSVRNFPVQGTGAVIMRLACKLFQARGGRVMGPLHDAIYAIYNIHNESDHPRLLSQCMQEAVDKILGPVEVRQDIDIHDHNHVWVEKKGKVYYEMLNQYLYPMKTDQDSINEIRKNVFRIKEQK